MRRMLRTIVISQILNMEEIIQVTLGLQKYRIKMEKSDNHVQLDQRTCCDLKRVSITLLQC